MKCPICGTILDKAFINDKIRGCPKCRNMGNIELWQELIRTRKALEMAIMGLKNCKTRDHIGAVCRTPEYVDKILEQIKKALEQKDVK